MLTDAHIAFVGSGAMAEAMIQGLLGKNIAQAHNIIAAGPRAERGQALEQRFQIATTTDNGAAVARAEIVVISVKPQMLPVVLPALWGKIASEALVLSIVAGARIDTLATGLAHPSVVRSMPNTPAQIGEGITVWLPSPSVSAEQRTMASTRSSAEASGVTDFMVTGRRRR